MSHSRLLDELITALRCLPGVGPKSAQRAAFHLLERDREGGRRLGEVLAEAMARIGHCKRCRTLSEADLCAICADSGRDQSVLCAVENPIDATAIEASTGFRGTYFVLMGRLSPLDGIGPDELGLSELQQRLGEEPIEELIIATNLTVEGEATARYLSEMAAAAGVGASRIAHGVPLGSELEYIDSSTLAHAFAGRQRVRD